MRRTVLVLLLGCALAACSSSSSGAKKPATSSTRPGSAKVSSGPTPTIHANLAAYPAWCQQIQTLSRTSNWDNAARAKAVGLLKQVPVHGLYVNADQWVQTPDEAHTIVINALKGCISYGYLR